MLARYRIAGALLALAVMGFLSSAGFAQEQSGKDSTLALTIYNQNFAVVRQSVPLNLVAGQNRVAFDGITSRLEPDSVILRDPTGKRDLRVLEQNYEADPLPENALLKRYEGQTIDFAVPQQNGGERIIPGKIIRSGGASYSINVAYSSYQEQMTAGAEQPIIEVDGKLRFGLPGTPLFPQLAASQILKPTLTWQLYADKPGAFNAELAYVTSDMTWESAYNVVSPPQGDTLDLTGWVTMTNHSGIDFPNVHVKLMAGTPNKVQPNAQNVDGMVVATESTAGASFATAPAVTEQTFDEYHLYTLPLPTNLINGETKQVEFVRGESIASKRIYVYDGAKIDQNRYNGWNYDNIRNEREYGTQSNPHIWTMREFVNSKENHLGIPLPKGKVRFYRQGDGGALEFVGENVIDHTPQGEIVRVFTGDAFDIVGERRQTNFVSDGEKRTLDETFEIRVRNRKKEPATVQIVEHPYRGLTWTIVAPSTPFTKRDSKTIEFAVTIPPNGEKVVTYTAHYTW